MNEFHDVPFRDDPAFAKLYNEIAETGEEIAEAEADIARLLKRIPTPLEQWKASAKRARAERLAYETEQREAAAHRQSMAKAAFAMAKANRMLAESQLSSLVTAARLKVSLMKRETELAKRPSAAALRTSTQRYFDTIRKNEVEDALASYRQLGARPPHELIAEHRQLATALRVH